MLSSMLIFTFTTMLGMAGGPVAFITTPIGMALIAF
jgi:hypothetical protein